MAKPKPKPIARRSERPARLGAQPNRGCVAFATVALLALFSVSPALGIHGHASVRADVHGAGETAATMLDLATVDSHEGDSDGCFLCSFAKRRGERQIAAASLSGFAVATTTHRAHARAPHQAVRKAAESSDSPRAPPAISG